MSGDSDILGGPETPGRDARWALIIDDHPLFCDALELTLRSVSSLGQIVTTDRIGKAFQILGKTRPPSLVVLDLNLPEVSGLEGLAQLRARFPSCPVLVVSSMAENGVIAGALDAGAAGFVPKHSPRPIFREALETVTQGGTFKPPGFVNPSGTATKEVRDAAARLAALTQQQARILAGICDGRLNKQIAYDFGISESTVKAHVTAVMRKLGVQNRTQAVLVAQEANFINLRQPDE